MSAISILLIRPETAYLNNAPSNLAPMGLMYISAYLKSRLNCQTKIIDLNKQKEDVIEYIKKNHVDYIGINSTSLEFKYAEALAERIKNSFESIPIVLGGPHITAFQEKAFHNDAFTYGIIGEGEVAFCDLINALSEHNALTHVDGLIYRDKKNQIKNNHKINYVENLDLLPFPDWDAVDMNSYTSTIQLPLTGQLSASIVSSRGCPYTCSFCHKVHGKTARLRSAENVFKEIQALYFDYNVRNIEFIDDVFNIDRQRLLDICKKIIASGIKISIYFGNAVRGDLLDREQIILLKKAGVKILTFSVEFGSERMQKVTAKYINLQKIEENIKIASRIGLCTAGYFMFNGPGETFQEMQQTSRFILESKLDLYYLVFLSPYPGTDVYDNMLSPAQKKEVLAYVQKNDYLTKNFYNISKAKREDILRLDIETRIQFMLNPVRICHLLLTYPYTKKLIEFFLPLYFFIFKQKMSNIVRNLKRSCKNMLIK